MSIGGWHGGRSASKLRLPLAIARRVSRPSMLDCSMCGYRHVRVLSRPQLGKGLDSATQLAAVADRDCISRDRLYLVRKRPSTTPAKDVRRDAFSSVERGILSGGHPFVLLISLPGYRRTKVHAGTTSFRAFSRGRGDEAAERDFSPDLSRDRRGGSRRFV